MAWPAWIDAIRDRYLADEGNLFLLTGALDAVWPVDGERLGAVEILSRFLSPTRPVVGVLRPGEPLVFPHLGDELRFERAISAREVVTGHRIRRRAADLPQRLDLVHAALQTTAHDQAWILVDAHRLFPPRRPLGGAEAPPLDAWAEPLRRTNHIVLLLAPSADEVAPALARAAIHVEVTRPEPERAPPPEPVVQPPPTPIHEPVDDPALPTPEELAEELEAALQLTLAHHPVAHWEGRLPVIEAAAIVLAAHDPSLGPITLAPGDDGQPVATGRGAEGFLARWQADVALDAAAGMLLRELPTSEGEHLEGPFELHPTALRALAKRLVRMLSA